MDLTTLLSFSAKREVKKNEISEERVNAAIPALRDYISFWREYPDLLVDFLSGIDTKFHLYFYQRVFLRAVMRHRYAYATFPRAYSKSFLSVLVLMLRCILYPGAHLFITTGGKEQAAGIAKEKVTELCTLVPGLKREIDFGSRQTTESKDSVSYAFHNSSVLDIIAAKQSSRGKRKHGGLIEEVILVDGTLLNEVILPTMNVSRRLPDGSFDDEETLNKSQIYVTTAGWKNSYAYQKLMELLIRQIIAPEEAIIIGGTWRVPVMEQLLSKNFVRDLKNSGTYNDNSFAREYESEWSGSSENAYFDADQFDKQRTLLQAETQYSSRSSKLAYYVIGIDVGRKGCTTEAAVFKVTPQAQGAAFKSLVNFYSFEDMHFGLQAIEIKKLFFKYKARRVAIDANGLGIGLVDFLISDQILPDGDVLPAFGVMNDSDNFYKKYKTPDMVKDALFLIKANAMLNTESFAYVQTQLASGKVKMLINERDAKVKLMDTKLGQNMTPNQRISALAPFVATTVLREQMLNLIEKNEGVNILLKQASRKIKKDKFSAFQYGLYYIKKEEENKKKRKTMDLSKMMLFS